MGALLDRSRELLARASDLQRLEATVRQLLIDDKRDQLLDSRDTEGAPLAPLAASTLERPRVDPRPLIPHGEGSRAISGYRVEITREPGRLHVEAGWPGVPWMRYQCEGGKHLPRRNVRGFRPAVLSRIRELLRDWVTLGRSA